MLDHESLRSVVAPMVGYSELAWRMMMRERGATLCYTPMINGSIFIRDSTHRSEEIQIHDKDRPLIVQFAANNPELFYACGKYVEPICDAVDLNLGCPQNIARKGRYGSFLQEDWQLINNILRQASAALSLPVTCKIRILDTLEKSIDYARMLERSGVSMICVHGRTRDQKGQFMGLANWDFIKAIKQSVSIPIISNGNIRYHSDIKDCLDYTRADGVMVAEGCLYNPYIFEPKNKSMFCAAREYIQYASKYSTPLYFWRGHIFKLLIHA
ncbi:tRNA-dihydrouridine(16/17) synthase [NAD(P)(+)]-like protein [Thelohanellus kitauei]|uniref:tRNA-dihydrouridine(16/17) synthase [NAD(P)(+)] n=1 Tax=Thelohanellus kitauei TaxID=669202 RepID=A0A0C2I6X9_THEKT|nr:tRNA-dihydrouridine(16/17) synthase [NAD(P)(+)]-like protein [Thelohanellus kitauei]